MWFFFFFHFVVTEIVEGLEKSWRPFLWPEGESEGEEGEWFLHRSESNALRKHGKRLDFKITNDFGK